MSSFKEKLEAAWSHAGSSLCVGLDPDLDRLPGKFRGAAEPFLSFNQAVIGATADLACSYKLQFAHYAATGAEEQILKTIRYIRTKSPRALVILDAKRGDIGSTARKYAVEAFDRYEADAVTVNPYMGDDTIEPFIERDDRGCIILCRTTNPGGALFQHQAKIGSQPVYLAVAERAAKVWNARNNVMLVVGATNPHDMAAVRALTPELPFLVPGVGEQGGDIAAVLAAGARADGKGLIVAASRSIIYAGSGSEADIRKAAEQLGRELAFG